MATQPEQPDYFDVDVTPLRDGTLGVLGYCFTFTNVTTQHRLRQVLLAIERIARRAGRDRSGWPPRR